MPNKQYRRSVLRNAAALGIVGSMSSIGTMGSATASSAANSNRLIVDKDNHRGNRYSSIQDAIDDAYAGDTIHVTPGRYLENLETVRDGVPGFPITITGPPSAIFSGGGDARSFEVHHSHIHITGLTLDGLWDPDNPNKGSSYRDKLVYCIPETADYLTDIKIKPHAVGNSGGEAIRLKMVFDAEVGEFDVIDPTGVEDFWFDGDGKNGEVVYIGTSPSQIDRNPGGNVDRSHNVHVHHINNRSGYGHSELVNTKEGTHNILVENCTGYGAIYPEGGSVNIQGSRSTVRYCDLSDNDGAGIRFGWATPHEDAPDAGTKNSAYYNRLKNNDGDAVKLPKDNAGVETQELICGNNYNGETADSPGESCPAYLPKPRGNHGSCGRSDTVARLN